MLLLYCVMSILTVAANRCISTAFSYFGMNLVTIEMDMSLLCKVCIYVGMR